MITDGIRVNGKHSYHDFDLLLAGRIDNLPERHSYRKTVPYMNGYYDFSAIAGEPTWGERSLEYEFDIIGDTPQQVEDIKTDVLEWLGNIHDADIFDDTTPDYHFHGSYDSCDPDYDESGLKVTLAVTFVCQPFKIANRETKYTLKSGANIVVNRGQTVIAYVDCDGSCIISAGDESQTITGNDIELLIPIKKGRNVLTLAGDTAKLHYQTEVI